MSSIHHLSWRSVNKRKPFRRWRRLARSRQEFLLLPLPPRLQRHKSFQRRRWDRHGRRVQRDDVCRRVCCATSLGVGLGPRRFRLCWFYSNSQKSSHSQPTWREKRIYWKLPRRAWASSAIALYAAERYPSFRSNLPSILASNSRLLRHRRCPFTFHEGASHRQRMARTAAHNSCEPRFNAA